MESRTHVANGSSVSEVFGCKSCLPETGFMKYSIEVCTARMLYKDVEKTELQSHICMALKWLISL